MSMEDDANFKELTLPPKVKRRGRKSQKLVPTRMKKSTLASSLKRAEKKKLKLREKRINLDKKITLLKTLKEVDTPKVVTEEEVQKVHAASLTEENVIFRPNPGPQTDFLAATEKEVFYGGARGGGKSYSLIVDPLRYCDKELARALILRRTMPELRDLINHSHRLYPKAYPGAKWREQEKEWRFPSGARIEFGYAETRQDALRYQGQAYTWIGIDELPQYPDGDILNDLRGSLRSVDPAIPEYIRATGNPGNIGSHWVREVFINPAVPGTRFEVPIEMPDGTKKFISRRFIPAKLHDNPYLMKTDAYQIMLASLPEIQRKQWLDGDWDAFENSAFPEFKRNLHVIEPFKIPTNWPRFRAADWGYSSPACVLWFAIDNDNNLFVYREYYGKGLNAEDFAKHILFLERGDNIRYGILDSSCWDKRGNTGPTIAETMIRNGCRFRPSDSGPGSRIQGKLELHRRFKIDNDITGQPKLKIFNTCLNLIRTLPALPLDKDKIEDVDTDAEDHAYDALRYGCMSRPMGSRGDGLIRHNQVKWEPVNKYFGY